MEKIRYYAYLETLKKLTGECALFGSDDEHLVCILYDRLLRIRNILVKKGLTGSDLPFPDRCGNAEELYMYLSLLLAEQKENII